MSEGGPSHYGKAAREGLRERSFELFAEYSVRLTAIVNVIVVLGNTAYDYGLHEFTLNPTNGGKTIRRPHRYCELWNKNSSGHWKISLFINNADIREELGGEVSHWFVSEHRSGPASNSTRQEETRMDS